MGYEIGTAVIIGNCAALQANLGQCSLNALNNGAASTFANVGIGFKAGASLSGATGSVAVGYCALQAETTGDCNVAIGGSAMLLANGSSRNIAIGYWAGRVLTGVDNVIVGVTAGCSITSGNYNTLVGSCAGQCMTTQTNNTAVGRLSQQAATGSNNTSLGQNSGTAGSGSFNIMIGSGTGVCVSGGCNVLIGNQVANLGAHLWSGCKNTIVGNCAGGNSQTSSSNTLIGFDAGRCLTTGCCNVVVGDSSGAAMSTGFLNVVIGGGGVQSAGRNITTGCCNVMIGGSAGGGVTTGVCNTHVGMSAGSLNATSASCNVYMGAFAGQDRNGCYNTAIGFLAFGGVGTDGNGDYNTTLGYSAGNTISSGSCNTVIGVNAEPSSATVSNEFTLGSTNVTNLRCNDTTISSLSDERDKTNIVDLDVGLNFINDMRPVKFDWNRRDGSFAGRKAYGFIAQELDILETTYGVSEYTRLVHKDNPDRWEADPMKTYPIIIKAIQELAQKIEALEAAINS